MKLLYFTIITSLLFVSCKKDNEFAIDSNTNTARDHILAENLFNEIQTLIYQAEQGNLDSFGCVTIIHDTISNPKTVSIDYGTVNCLCSDGKNRRGLITASYTGNFSDSGTVVIISTSDFYSNDHKIDGTKTITNMGTNSNNHSWFTINESGTVKKANSSGSISWYAYHTREWVQGETTTGSDWQDDVYEITGNAYGTNTDGSSFSAIIREPLRIEMICQQFTSGRIEFTPSNRPIRLINLGSGACDNKALITINENVFEITLY